MGSQRDELVARCGELQGQLVSLQAESAATVEAVRTEAAGVRAQAAKNEAKLREEYTAQLLQAAATYAR